MVLNDRLDPLLRQFNGAEDGTPASTAKRDFFQDYTHARIIVNAASREASEEEPPVAAPLNFPSSMP